MQLSLISASVPHSMNRWTRCSARVASVFPRAPPEPPLHDDRSGADRRGALWACGRRERAGRAHGHAAHGGHARRCASTRPRRCRAEAGDVDAGAHRRRRRSRLQGRRARVGGRRSRRGRAGRGAPVDVRAGQAKRQAAREPHPGALPLRAAAAPPEIVAPPKPADEVVGSYRRDHAASGPWRAGRGARHGYAESSEPRDVGLPAEPHHAHRGASWVGARSARDRARRVHRASRGRGHRAAHLSARLRCRARVRTSS